MKKKSLCCVIAVVLFIIFIAVFFYRSSSVSKEKDEVTFTISAGTNKFQIVSNLKDADIIKSKLAGFVYVLFENNMQAGTYLIDKSNNTKEIINQIGSGKTNMKAGTKKITFVEGDRFKNYIHNICENLNCDEEQTIKTLESKEFLQSVIDKYWFISDEVLNTKLYYPLEGYLFPNTYEVYENALPEDVIYKMLDNLAQILEEYKEDIEKNSYTVHEILTMASIVEKEALDYEDRTKVAQVIYKRLDLKMTLGMDVTSYYGVFKDMNEIITGDDLNDNNPYNTRSNYVKGLPVGPICSPSKDSIKAVLNPSDTDYIYFVADIKTGKVYFAKDNNEFYILKQRYL